MRCSPQSGPPKRSRCPVCSALWAWVSVYSITPVLVFSAWLRNRRADPGMLDASDAPGPSTGTVEVRARTSVGEIAIRRPDTAEAFRSRFQAREPGAPERRSPD